MASAHINSNRASHSRSSSVSSHRVPVPPLIPIPHSLHGIDVFSPFIPSSNSVASSYADKIEAASIAMNASLPTQNNVSNNNDVPQSHDASVSSPVAPVTPQRIHFALPSPPLPIYHTKIPSSRFNSTTQLGPNQHYRVHSSDSEKQASGSHYGRSTSANQQTVLPKPTTFLESVLYLVEAFGALISKWYSALIRGIRSKAGALPRTLANVCFRHRHGKHALPVFEEGRSKLSDSIEDSYVPVGLPSSLAVRIKTAECGEVEIEVGIMDGDRGVEVPYQIYRKAGDPDVVLKADILFLQDSPFTSSNIPPFVAAFIRDGYRLIIPHLNVADSGIFGSAGQSTDIGRKARLSADVIEHVRSKDASDRAARLKAKIERNKQYTNDEQMTDAEKIKQAACSPIQAAVHGVSPVRGELFDLETLRTERPMFLLGLGHSALVALTYPIENMSPSGFPYKNSPSAFSFPSLSMRAEPSETLLSKLNSFRGSISSGLSGTGWWARDPHGEGKPKSHARYDSKELKRADAVSVAGIIAIGPTLDPNQVVKSSNIFMRFSRKPQISPNGVGPTSYLPSIKSAIEKLHLNAHKIRIPVLIAHGTKEAYSCIAGINSLYEALASPDCTLIFCPTLRHNAHLATDAARNGLAAESLAWLSQRRSPDQNNTKIKLLGRGAGVNHKGVPLPHQPSLGLQLSALSALSAKKSRNSTPLEVIPESIQDRFESNPKASIDTDRPAYPRCSSSLSQNQQAILSQSAEEGLLEELREEPQPRLSALLGLGVSIPSRSASPSSFSNRRSTGGVMSPHSRTSSRASSRQVRPSFDSSRRGSQDLLSLPFATAGDHSMLEARSHSPTPSSVPSSPGPLTPEGAMFPESDLLYQGAMQGNNQKASNKHHSHGTNRYSSSIMTRPSIDSLCIDIPGSSLGISY
ncbi:uncharacterized protein MELLADRAFT_92418 [Melampsora larici-populina 98AG31]|uniref:Serine aminopeptidase S33 domain-containing protein n=1 Tax=Melampsora larici-populina (strain 98AG31 / pathotype 3-4-7) TaxID=747676 RepID=F4R9K1_MELLP|nr:uncharacterized protein MELLADRAFT_92418 [Melampsora larici-populina 98AG31]EGG10993.1 hypothetical protein MELLADRAFT_92418 [Melampsora larici-populina 98AG31]